MKRLNLKGGPASAADMREAANMPNGDAPPSGGSPSGGSPRRSGGGHPGRSFLNSYVNQRLFNEKNTQQGEAAALVSTIRGMNEAGGLAEVDLGGGDMKHLVAHGNESFGKAVGNARKGVVSSLSEDEILEQLGGEKAAALRRMQATGNVLDSHHQGMVHGAERVLTAAGSDLVSGEEELRQAALRAMQVEQEQLVKAWGLNPGNEPGGADQDFGLFEGLPRMDNLAPWQTSAAYGMAAAGAGAAGIALANHLLAKGQQQSDPIAYAQAMQAMNAY